MSRILVSGLVNTETSVRVRRFPIPYYPIDYPFFGVSTVVSGVARNVASALKTLGDEVSLLSMTGQDFQGEYVRSTLSAAGMDIRRVLPCLRETPSSVVLYDEDGRRQIYSDLKDIQEREYPFPADALDGMELAVACNINFNRPLLRLAKERGVPIATDVHVLGDIWDGYNREFLEHADLLFLSDEAVGDGYRDFLRELAAHYGPQVIVMGRGGRGAAMYLRETGEILDLPARPVGEVVNTVGAGDALFSAFVHYYAKGLHPVDALERAQTFAAAKIRVSGASKGFVNEVELERLYHR